MRILEPDEIGKLLKVAPDRYRPILALAFGTGLRLGEVLGLTWADVDAKAGVLHVRKQANRKGNRVAPKTAQAVRAVNLPSSLVTMLREYRMASRHKAGSDFVFASSTGTALGHRNVTRRGLDVAADEAGLNPPGLPRLRFHDARHTFASLLVSSGLNVVYVSRQLGHSSPDITLRVYSHKVSQAEHAAKGTAAG